MVRKLEGEKSKKEMTFNYRGTQFSTEHNLQLIHVHFLKSSLRETVNHQTRHLEHIDTVDGDGQSQSLQRKKTQIFCRFELCGCSCVLRYSRAIG